MPDRLTYRPTTPVFLFLSILVGMAACGLLGSDDNERKLLNVTAVSAVEVFLEVRAFPGAEISIERDGEEIYSFLMSRPDTLLTDSGLLPATDYRWTAVTKNGLNRTETRRAATLDTTSSEFTWETFTFGEHSSSVLRGISIIDENNIWAVGEIYMNDSTGQADSDAYNAAHWNGNNWELKKLQFYTFCNQTSTGSYPATSVTAFSEDDIWISSASQITRFDGIEQKVIDCIPASANKLWGDDTTRVFAVGSNGSLAHYNGQSWQKIETGTDLDVYDIHGNEEQGVVAIAAKRSESRDKKILRIKDNLKIESLSTSPIPFSIHGIWFDASGVTYIVGSGLFIKPDVDSTAPWKPMHQNITPYYLEAIDANGLNDIVTVGAFGEFLHFNGAKWISFQQQFDGNLLGDVAIQGNTTVAVGFEGRQAFITIGIRK